MSRYDLIRKRIAPFALFAGLALIAHDTCEKAERTHTTVELAFGDSRPSVRAVNVDVVVDDDVVATYHRAALPGSLIGPCRIPLALIGVDGELRIDVDRGGSHQLLTRRFHAIEGSTTTVEIPAPDPR